MAPRGGQRVTLARLLEALREGPDVLYLVCHGALVDGEPKLLLERADGKGHVVSGHELVRELKTLQILPRLVVLVSCQSGGNEDRASQDDRNLLSSIGPRLAEAGVAAVLAMQGNLQMSTARKFFPPFFTTLRETGQVDEAVLDGRAAVRTASDAWVPVLYTRLVEGRVWFRKGLTGKDDFDAWPELIRQIDKGTSVPILGSGLLEPFVGSSRELANDLAKLEGYPLALSGREDLPQIVQFIKTMRTDDFARDRLTRAMVDSVKRRWPGLKSAQPDDLSELLLAAWKELQAKNPFEPHRYLAHLGRFKSIITTNPDDLMKQALQDAGKQPRVHTLEWEDSEQADDEDNVSYQVEPSFDTPDLYQLYGYLKKPETVVATEDDYFQFLTSMTRRGGLKRDEKRQSTDFVDTWLRGTLAGSGLIFLGFRITDWDFRTLFRLLIEQNGKRKRGGLMHIAAQLDPEDGTHSDALRARKYIENLFKELIGDHKRGKIAIYWGSPEDFMRDLELQWKALMPNPKAPVAERTLTTV